MASVEPRLDGVDPRLFCFRAGSIVVLAVVLANVESISAMPGDQAARFTLTAVSVLCVLCVWARPSGVLACSSVYLGLLALFHFGLAGLLALDLPLLSDDRQLDFGWLLSAPVGRSLALAAVGVAAAAVGMSIPGPVPLVARRRRAGAPERAMPARGTASPASHVGQDGQDSQESTDGQDGQDGLDERPLSGSTSFLTGLAGFGILAASIVMLLVTVVRAGGPRLLLGSYTELINLAYQNPLVPFLDFGLGFGLMLVTVAGNRRQRRAGWLLFGLFAVVALPLGMRGNILFPACAAATAHALFASSGHRAAAMEPDAPQPAPAGSRHALLHRSAVAVAVLACVVALGAVGALRDIRQHGLAQVQLSDIGVSPVDGLAEMGASLRPVAEVVRWRDQLSEPAADGRTYTGQLVRVVQGRLAGIPQPSADTDQRLFNTLIRNRAGPYGGSPIAEAYYNFGLSGVVLVMLAIGLLCGWLDTSRSRRASGVCVVVLVPLLIGVRNDFTPLPMQVLVGAVALAVLRIVDRLWQHGRPPSGSTATETSGDAQPTSTAAASLPAQRTSGARRSRSLALGEASAEERAP